MRHKIVVGYHKVSCTSVINFSIYSHIFYGTSVAEFITIYRKFVTITNRQNAGNWELLWMSKINNNINCLFCEYLQLFVDIDASVSV